jgi:hypothetical protein
MLAFGLYTLKSGFDWPQMTTHYIILGVGFIIVSIGLVALAISYYAMYDLKKHLYKWAQLKMWCQSQKIVKKTSVAYKR